LNKVVFFANDDGESCYFVEQPIYGKIIVHKLDESHGTCNLIFGGIKIGIAGLNRSYKISAQGAPQNSAIAEHFLKGVLEFFFDC
jgi:putative IMPACT (imprinted ancient) family translation regulator